MIKLKPASKFFKHIVTAWSRQNVGFSFGHLYLPYVWQSDRSYCLLLAYNFISDTQNVILKVLTIVTV